MRNAYPSKYDFSLPTSESRTWTQSYVAESLVLLRQLKKLP
jgi:hypothetical protein